MIATTESWLNETIDSDFFSMVGYSFFRDDRLSRTGGGVCMWCHNSLYPESVRSDKLNLVEHLVVYLKKINTYVILVYIPPNLNVSQRLAIDNCITDVLDKCLLLKPDCEFIICGDFNNFDIRNLVISYSLQNKVCSPTRGDSLLDVILTSERLSDRYSQATDLSTLSSSDHNCLLLHSPVCDASSPSNKTKHVALDLRKSNVDQFLHKLSVVDFSVIYHTVGIEKKVDLFYSIIYECMKCIPKYTVYFGTEDKPWITPYLKHLINLRWKAFRRHDFQLYNHYKAKVKSEIVAAKSRWASKSCESPKSLWQIVNEFTGTKRKCELDSLLCNFTDTKSAVNVINDSFTNNAKQPILQCCNDPTRPVSIDWCPLTEVIDIFRTLKKINPKKATGSDEIPNLLIREGAILLSEPLCHLINCSILEKTVPCKWKIAKILPVPKTRPPRLNSLRPISLLPTFSKVLERVVLNNTQHMFHSKISANQYAYRPLSSVTNALIIIHDKITSFLEESDAIGVAVLQLDFSRAFDTISHRLLLHKLHNLGFPDNFVSWTESYLTDRTQCTVINNVASSRKAMKSGVPQGSVIGPHYFTAYTSDLLDVSHVIKYADDTTLIFKITNDIAASIRTITSHMDDIHDYCLSNALNLNIDKTKMMVIRKKNMDFDTRFAVPDVELVKHLKILGVTFSSDLTWNPHYDEILSRANRRLYALRVLRNVLNDKDALFNVFSALIRSVIEFASPLFVALPVYLDTRILHFLKRCHRLVHGFECECTMFSQLVTRRNNAAVKLFRAAEHNPQHSLHHIIPARLPKSKQYNISFCHTTRRQKCFTQHMPVYMNNLHQDK